MKTYTISEIESLLKAVTPGEWRLNPAGWCIEADIHENQFFLSCARAIVEQLLREREAYRLIAIDGWHGGKEYCFEKDNEGRCQMAVDEEAQRLMKESK